MLTIFGVHIIGKGETNIFSINVECHNGHLSCYDRMKTGHFEMAATMAITMEMKQIPKILL